MADPGEVFAEDEEVVITVLRVTFDRATERAEKKMDVGDPPINGVLHRDDGEIRFTITYGVERRLKCRPRNCLGVRYGLSRRKIGVCARFTLERDGLGPGNQSALCHVRSLATAARAFSRSAGVSTLCG